MPMDCATTIIGMATGKDHEMIGQLIVGVVIGGSIGAFLGYFGKRFSRACPLTVNPYRGAVYGAVMGLIFSLIMGWGAKKAEPREPVREETPRAVSAAETAQAPKKRALLHIENEADFKALVINARGICLVELYSDRCPPCKALAPTISLLADRYAGRAIVCKVNVDHTSAVAQRYEIRAIPTVLFLKEGKEMQRLMGLRPKEDYASILDGLIGQDKE